MQYSVILSIASALSLAIAAPAPSPVVVRDPTRVLAARAYATTVDNNDKATNVICNNLGNKPSYSDSHAAYMDFINNGKDECIGPKSCVVIGSHGKAKWSYCNDNAYGKCLAGQDLASRITHTLNACGYQSVDFTGQEFYGDGTNVLLKHS